MQDASTPSAEPHTAAPLPDDSHFLQQMVRELLTTVHQLRSTIDKQAAHIHYLVRMTFGRRSERMKGPTLFDDCPPPEAATLPAEPEPDTTVVVKRKSHGRRQRPIDLPCEREVFDVTEAEKVCPCCGEQGIKIGADVSSRVEYRPACLFRRELERPTYTCRRCEQQGENIQAVQAPLPPEPIVHKYARHWFLSSSSCTNTTPIRPPAGAYVARNVL
jgi:transposase